MGRAHLKRSGCTSRLRDGAEGRLVGPQDVPRVLGLITVHLCLSGLIGSPKKEETDVSSALIGSSNPVRRSRAREFDKISGVKL